MNLNHELERLWIGTTVNWSDFTEHGHGFHDLVVSRRHAKVSASSQKVSVE